MEGHFLTSESPQWTVVPVEEAEKEEEEDEEEAEEEDKQVFAFNRLNKLVLATETGCFLEVVKGFNRNYNALTC